MSSACRPARSACGRRRCPAIRAHPLAAHGSQPQPCPCPPPSFAVHFLLPAVRARNRFGLPATVRAVLRPCASLLAFAATVLLLAHTDAGFVEDAGAGHLIGKDFAEIWLRLRVFRILGTAYLFRTDCGKRVTWENAGK